MLRIGAALVALAVAPVGAARADRVVLAPNADTLGPSAFKTEFEVSPVKGDPSLGFLQYSTSQSIELETERYGAGDAQRARYGLNVEYPLLYDLGAFPAISVGVLDALGTGFEHKAVYAAATKSIPLSDRQLRVLRMFKVTAGFGTGRLDGPFVGLQSRLATGATVSLEFYRRRPNVSIGFPLARHLQAKAFSLDGTVYYGLAFALNR